MAFRNRHLYVGFYNICLFVFVKSQIHFSVYISLFSGACLVAVLKNSHYQTQSMVVGQIGEMSTVNARELVEVECACVVVIAPILDRDSGEEIV